MISLLLEYWESGHIGLYPSHGHSGWEVPSPLPPSSLWDMCFAVFHSYHFSLVCPWHWDCRSPFIPVLTVVFLFLRLKESGYFLNLFLSLSENVKGRPRGWHVEGKTVESILESKTILFNAADLCVARIYLKTPGPLCSSVLPAWSL